MAWKSDQYNAALGRFTNKFNNLLSVHQSDCSFLWDIVRDICWPPTILRNMKRERFFVIHLQSTASHPLPLNFEKADGRVTLPAANALLTDVAQISRMDMGVLLQSIMIYYAARFSLLALLLIAVIGFILLFVKCGVL